MQKHLTANGIQTGVHYPIPIHLQPAYASLGYRPGDLAVTERLSERVLSLPMFPGLSPDSQRHVVSEVLRSAAERETGAQVAPGPVSVGRQRLGPSPALVGHQRASQ